MTFFGLGKIHQTLQGLEGPKGSSLEITAEKNILYPCTDLKHTSTLTLDMCVCLAIHTPLRIQMQEGFSTSLPLSCTYII